MAGKSIGRKNFWRENVWREKTLAGETFGGKLLAGKTLAGIFYNFEFGEVSEVRSKSSRTVALVDLVKSSKEHLIAKIGADTAENGPSGNFGKWRVKEVLCIFPGQGI